MGDRPRLWLSCALGLALGLVTGGARADKMGETLDISIGPRTSWVMLDQPLRHDPFTDPVDVIERSAPSLVGTGQMWGAVARGGLTLDGVHFGLGTGVHGVTTMRLEHQPLDHGMTLSPGGLWGTSYEIFAGYTFGDPRSVRPYLEARGSVTVLYSHLALAHPSLGDLGEHPVYTHFWGLEIRAGLRLPLGEYFFVNTGVGVAPVGPERVSMFAMLGVPIPLDNL